MSNLIEQLNSVDKNPEAVRNPEELVAVRRLFQNSLDAFKPPVVNDTASRFYIASQALRGLSPEIKKGTEITHKRAYALGQFASITYALGNATPEVPEGLRIPINKRITNAPQPQTTKSIDELLVMKKVLLPDINDYLKLLKYYRVPAYPDIIQEGVFKVLTNKHLNNIRLLGDYHFSTGVVGGINYVLNEGNLTGLTRIK